MRLDAEVPGKQSAERELAATPQRRRRDDEAENQLLGSRSSPRSSRCPPRRRTRAPATAGRSVASGLDNPRGLDVAKNGDSGSPKPARAARRRASPRPESDSGLLRQHRRLHARPQRRQKRVVSGLPVVRRRGHRRQRHSVAADVIVNGKKVTGLIGGGGTPEQRAVARQGAGALFGWVVKIDPWKGTVWPFADFSQYEADEQPGRRRDRLGRVRPRAASRRLRRRRRGRQRRARRQLQEAASRRWPCSRTRRSTHRRSSALPAGDEDPDAGRPDDRRGAAEGSERLRRPADGLPVPARRGASVWAHQARRLDRPCTPRASRTSSTSRGARRAPSTCSRSRPTASSPDDPTGALIRVWPNGKQTVVASKGLVTPTGVAIGKDGSVYVSNYGTSAGKGTVVNIGKV